jgi:hypothetical protein
MFTDARQAIGTLLRGSRLLRLQNERRWRVLVPFANGNLSDKSVYPYIDIFANCSWVATWWQQYSTHYTQTSKGKGKAVPLQA